MIPFVASPYSGKGWPDSAVCAQGMFVAIEWKSPEGQPTPIQLHRIEQIRKAGGCAFVSDDGALAVAAIKLWVADGIMPPVQVRRARGTS